ncbi:MAG: adenylate/guanylate cyclase domain-containing protein [Kiloniellales bacterium]
MPPKAISRKLAAILAADVVGYSRLMEADEAGTLGKLKSHRKQLIDPAIAQHRGRIVKTTGDGVLGEFASVVDAVECAVEIQLGMSGRNTNVREGQRIEYRIGINLGDVIVDGEDIYGDGVNVASRVEGLADPGGICISGTVHEHVEGKLDLMFEDLGQQKVKNIKRAVQVYRVPVASEAASADGPALELPDKPSIAVLPFVNMSGDPDQEYFGDGIAEDIITGLSRISALFVIARNSTFAYKGKAVDVKRIARDLGVRYVLEGSVRKAGERLRITAQLIDAPAGRHIWAERYDRRLVDMFDLQDEIARSVVATCQTQLDLSEGLFAESSARPDIRVWDLLSRAWRMMYRLTERSLREARHLAERAVELDPSSGRAHRVLAVIDYHLVWMGYTNDGRRTLESARKSAESAVRLDDGDEYAHWGKGLVHMACGEHEEAIGEFQRALEINPNCSLAYGSLGTVLAFAGRTEESIANIELAIRSNPRDPSIFFRFSGLAIANFVAGDYDAAIEWARKSVQRKPDWYQGHIVLAASFSRLGRIDEARQAVRKYLERFSDAGVSKLKSLPFKNDADRDALLDALRTAGLPE